MPGIQPVSRCQRDRSVGISECARSHLARESGSADIASRTVGIIAERFWLLARYPYLGRARDEDLRPGLRSYPAGDYVIIYRVVEHDVVLILHVVSRQKLVLNCVNTYLY
jgi:plasmid stabilization system protein ParE